MKGADRLRWAGLEGMLLVALLRAFIAIEPQVWFDVDPALDPMPLLAAGATASHVLDLALLACAACALAGERLSGRGVRAGLVVLALAPLPVVALHGGLMDFENAFRGSTWIAAMAAFVALSHLVRDRSMRAVALGVLASAAVLLAVRGAVQVLVEHPATVALYNETKDAFLAERGWAADGAATRSYERRLMQPEASGWFGLANPFSMAMGVGALAFGAIAVLARGRQQAGSTLLLAMAALGCAALLAVNGGKGAILATGIACVALVAWWRAGGAPRAGWVLALAALALLAVVARGSIGLALGEKSLLFRAFYLEAGWNLLKDPDVLLLGTGPDGVQPFFNRAKPPECPEDVKSLHSVFADWIVTLGVAGAAWVAVVVRSFLGRPALEGDAPDPARMRRGVLVFALATGAIALLLQLVVEQPTVDLAWFVFRTVGVVAFALVAASAAEALALLEARATAVVAVAVACLALVHSQIETNMWMPSSAVLVVLLAATGTGLPAVQPATGAVGRLWSRGLAVAAAFALAATLVAGFGWAMSAAARESHMRAAARELVPLGELRRAGGAPEAGVEFEARMRAIELLGRDSRSRSAVDASVRQAIAAARRSPERAPEALDAADGLLRNRLLAGPRVDALRADLALERLRLLRLDADAARACVADVERVTERQPKNPRRWIDLGLARESCARFGGCGDPVPAYEQALAVNERMFLDPLVQLSEREIAFVRGAIARVRGKVGP